MDKSDQQPADVQAAPEKSSLKDISLKAAGYSYLVGDAALCTAKLLEGDKDGARGSLLWAVGGIAAARYGNPKPEKQLELFERHLGSYLKANHVVIPKDISCTALRKEGGIIDNVEDFIYKYPSEMLNATYGIGAIGVITGGIKSKNTADIASGILIAAGAVAGLLLKEKKPDPKNPPQTGTQKLLSWAQEKPLRVSGALYGLNNAFTLYGAYDKQNKAPQTKSYMFRYATAASYIFANIMTSMSSKENDASKYPEVKAKLAEVSAQVIAAQPKETQEALLQNIAGYLAAQPGMKQTASELADLLHAKLKAMAPATPQTTAANEKTWEGKVAQTGLAAAPSL